MHTITRAPADSSTEKLLTAEEVSTLLGVTPRWVIEKARSGALPSVKLPGSNRVRFLWSEIDHKMRGG